MRAGIGYAPTEAMNEGHCGLPAAELGPLSACLLEVPDDAIWTALELALAEGTVVADTAADTPCVFLGDLYRAERAIAEQFLRIAAGRPPWPGFDVDRPPRWVARKTGLSLALGQAEAVRLALRSKAVVITGGPNVDKTTILNAILRILAAKGVELQTVRADRPRRPQDERGHGGSGHDHMAALVATLSPAAGDRPRRRLAVPPRRNAHGLGSTIPLH